MNVISNTAGDTTAVQELSVIRDFLSPLGLEELSPVFGRALSELLATETINAVAALALGHDHGDFKITASIIAFARSHRDEIGRLHSAVVLFKKQYGPVEDSESKHD